MHYPSTEKIKISNYPYGYTLKTDKFYSLEYRQGKGSRLVTQTLNPKTGLLNKPKKSTYSPIMLLTLNDEGHVKAHVEDFYNDEGKNRGYKFMFDNFDKFTPEEIEGTALHNIMLLKADIVAKYSDGVTLDCVSEDNEDEFDAACDCLESDFLQTLLECYATMLQEECDHLMSSEAIIETIEANEYDFTEDGRLD